MRFSFALAGTVASVAIFSTVTGFGASSHRTSTSALANIPEPAVDAPLAHASGRTTAVFAGGCFWGMQAVFEHVRGVVDVKAGYSGGEANTAEYEVVSTGTTGHAESVQVTYDPSQITYGQLLKVFFSVAHDPTELDYQGPDHGTQYRSAIFFATPDQQRIAQAYIDQLGHAKVFPQTIVTQITPLKGFYAAESYHQDYFYSHPFSPYILINDKPKVEHLRTEWPALYHDYAPTHS